MGLQHYIQMGNRRDPIQASLWVERVLYLELELKTLRFAREHSLPLEDALTERLLTLEDLDEARLQSFLCQELAKSKAQKFHNLKAKIYRFTKGQLVLFYDARNELFPGKLETLWDGPYQVIRVGRNNTVQLAELNSTLFKTKVNINKVKLYYV